MAYYFYLALVPKLEATTGSWEATGSVIAPCKPWCRERRYRGWPPAAPFTLHRLGCESCSQASRSSIYLPPQSSDWSLRFCCCAARKSWFHRDPLSSGRVLPERGSEKTSRARAGLVQLREPREREGEARQSQALPGGSSPFLPSSYYHCTGRDSGKNHMRMETRSFLLSYSVTGKCGRPQRNLTLEWNPARAGRRPGRERELPLSEDPPVHTGQLQSHILTI